MKKIRIVLIGIFIWSLTSCVEETKIVEEHPSLHIKIHSASISYQNKFKNWIKTSNNARLVGLDYDAKDLKLVENTDLGSYRFAVLNRNNENEALSFIFNENGEIDKAVISRSEKLDNGSVKSQIFTVENEEILQFTFHSNGTLDINNMSFPANVKILGWWDNFDECVGLVLGPFESNVANLAMDAVFSAATLGMWVPSVLASCSVAAAFM